MDALIGDSPATKGLRGGVVHHDQFRDSLTEAANMAIGRYLRTARAATEPQAKPSLRRR